MSRHPVIVDAIRTATGRGKANGALASIHPVDLLAGVLEALVSRNGIDPGIVDDVIIGCVTQIGEQTMAPRMAVLAAGFPDHVPATAIDRKCGSSQQAIHFAAHAIAAGACDIVIAGGVESMSRVPIGSNRIGKDIAGERVRARYTPGLVSQGVATELIAARWGISRDDMDEYSALSHSLPRPQARPAASMRRSSPSVRITGRSRMMRPSGRRPPQRGSPSFSRSSWIPPWRNASPKFSGA